MLSNFMNYRMKKLLSGKERKGLIYVNLDVLIVSIKTTSSNMVGREISKIGNDSTQLGIIFVTKNAAVLKIISNFQ